jgi:UDP-N-acetylglucosamine 2-epimerase
LDRGQFKKMPIDFRELQKEACMLGVPYITLWKYTEWVETGWYLLVGANMR